jgi:hypothetical protein
VETPTTAARRLRLSSTGSRSARTPQDAGEHKTARCGWTKRRPHVNAQGARQMLVSGTRTEAERS